MRHEIRSRKDLRHLPALFFFKTAHSLPLVAAVVANQFPHSQFTFAELILLTLALSPDGSGVVTVRNEHQTAIVMMSWMCRY
ncbi:hypothetical protein [Xenorhabdus sp. KK7.4]|uniref:hypothetical protein n=1 Tax=Xenorhabdus sp. KK7.4 TaxID=1851572 RepID=UPI00187BCBD4|nr:hypothetical protein [Xenorhabdus sp. KK7.4]